MKTQFNFTTCTCCALFHLQSIAIMHLHLHVKLHENPPFYNLYVLRIVSFTINCNHASAFACKIAWKSPFLQPVRVVHCFNCNWKGVSACKVVWKHNLTSQPVRVVHCNSASAFAFQIAWKSPFLQPVRVVHCFNCNWKGVSACKVVWKHNLTSQPVRVVHCNSASAFAFQIAWKSPLLQPVRVVQPCEGLPAGLARTCVHKIQHWDEENEHEDNDEDVDEVEACPCVQYTTWCRWCCCSFWSTILRFFAHICLTILTLSNTQSHMICLLGEILFLASSKLKKKHC